MINSKSILPAFGENNVPIVFSTDEAFVPVLSVMLQSIIDNSSCNNNYDIIILSKDMNDDYKGRILLMIDGYDNFSIRIINVAEYLVGYNFYTENRKTITAETYFRLLMPELMNAYSKAIYLDGDMIANVDIAELYNIDISNYLIAASRDCDSIGRYNIPDKDIKEYRDTVLKLKYPNDYFCAGVLLMNLDMFREDFKEINLLEFATSYQWRQHDQDILNVLCNEKVLLLSAAWDLLRDAGNNKYMPGDYYYDFLEAEKHPKIVHFGGMRKPWIYFDVERGEYFWKYAGKTPFYKQILSMVRDANFQRYSPWVPNTNTSSAVDPTSYKDEVAEQFKAGQIGFTYILKYIKAWVKYKLK